MTSRDPAAAMSAADDASAAAGHSGPAAPWRRYSKAQLFGMAALLLLFAALIRGAWTHYQQHNQAIADAEKRRSFVPMVQVATVKESEAVTHTTWPGTILGYTQASIFARATGYISTRNVDIGSKVRAGDVLAVIAAPDLDQQLAQARGQLVQMQAAVEQAKATAELGRVTTSRSSKLVSADSVSRQQADNDRLTYASEKAATRGGGGECRGAAGGGRPPRATGRLREGHGALRRHGHRALRRRRGARSGRFQQRDIPVHDDSQQCDPRPDLYSAGSGLRPDARGGGRRPRARNGSTRISRQGDESGGGAGARHAHAARRNRRPQPQPRLDRPEPIAP